MSMDDPICIHTYTRELQLEGKLLVMEGGMSRSRGFFKKGIKKIKIRKRGAGWEKFGKWVPPAL
jgi:hypothetical protein